jgi:alkanesulfonate monooxygenase SsuD/methylene tetrahydromethanopterin reductase-like flavin-dependent oxidoreductase (luciferase family)
MKFGVFYEHQLPRPWNANSEYELFQNSLAQVELADRLGFDYMWEVEHHFLEEYSHSSAPEVFLAAASQRTKRIRLGHGIVQITTNQPHRVAERVSTLDQISGGRVELGMGEGAGPAELHPFGLRVRDKRARWAEAVKAIVPMFTEESGEVHGQY